MARDATSSSLRRRPSRTVPAAVVAALITAGGLVGVWATVARLVTGSWPSWVTQTHEWARTHTWGSWIVVALSVTVALVGLLLLMTALRPGMPNAYRISLPAAVDPRLQGQSSPAQSGTTEFVMTRRAIAKLATAHAALVDGVGSVSAGVTSRRVTMLVQTASTQTEEIDQLVTRRVTDALAAVGLSPQPTVSTRVRTTQP